LFFLEQLIIEIRYLNNKEQNIINRIKSGDEQPIFDIYSKYRDEFIIWSTKNYQIDSEFSKDIFQETLLDFNENVHSEKLTNLTSSIKTYLFQIGKHKILNYQKKQARTTYIESVHVIESKEHIDFMDNEQKIYTQEQISNAIEKLPKDCQKVLKLYYFKEFDMDSIAREMDYKNGDTAKSKKSLCMKKLIKELNKIKMFVL
jgi:RNA polymerase sigma-70 factor (ECF subfamily)